jgi:hypothetical protein
MRAHLFYKPKILQIGELKDACERAVGAALGPNFTITVRYPRYPSPGVKDEVRLDAESLRPVVDLNNVEFTMTANAQDSKSYGAIYLDFGRAVQGKSFAIFASDEGSFRCLEKIVVLLGLEQTEEPIDDLEALETRVAALEKAAKEAGSNPKCFISFKFDDPQTVTQVNRLKRLLAAVHIEFLTGEQFEPRRIEDKVKARLRADVDFLVAVITKGGESKWIRDEIADANARGLWIVILLEEGATFDKGIFGTLEYISYNAAIEQTFPAVLEGVNFIRADISTGSSRKN